MGPLVGVGQELPDGNRPRAPLQHATALRERHHLEATAGRKRWTTERRLKSFRRIINQANFTTWTFNPLTHHRGATLSAHFVSPDVELPLASVRVALQQRRTHAEDLLHDGVLPQVVLTLSATRGQRSHKSHNSRQDQVDAELFTRM